MSTEDKPKVKVAVTEENSNLQAAAKQSVILPVDSLAKAKTTQTAQDPAPNTSAIQKATQQCASLPQKRIVARESVEKKTEQG